jgi:hypothetical protein
MVNRAVRSLCEQCEEQEVGGRWVPLWRFNVAFLLGCFLGGLVGALVVVLLW